MTKILYVEDDIEVGKCVVMGLERQCITTILVDDPDKIATAPTDIDGMLTDGQFAPTGKTCVDSIAEWKKYFPNKPYIIFTGNGDVCDSMKAKGYNAIMKPMSAKQLAPILEQYIGK